MKRAIIFFILMGFAAAPAQAVLVSDDFVRNTLDSSLEIKTQKQKLQVDEFVRENLAKNLKIKEYEPEKHILEDNFAKNRTCALPAVYKVHYFEDDFLPKNVKKSTKKMRIADFSGKEIPVRVKIKKLLSTKSKPDEGQFVEFETISDVNLNNTVYPKGTVVKGRIETVSQNGFSGVPADLVVGNFNLKGIPLRGELQKRGKNHSVWVYPCAYVGSFFFGAGILFMLVRGGQAAILPEETYTLYWQKPL